MHQLLSASLWDNIRQHVTEGRATRAAIAYIGKDAPRILPLGAGDSIIVDGSDRALRAGVTHPDAVKRWMRHGVVVHSLPGLHAKVLLVQGDQSLAVVGSANVSAHSRDALHEAAVVSGDSALCEQVEGLIDAWTADSGPPLDARWVKRAVTIYRAPEGGKTRKRPARVYPSN